MSDSGSIRRPEPPPSGLEAPLASAEMTGGGVPSASQVVRTDDRTVITSAAPIQGPTSAAETGRLSPGKILEGERLGKLVLKEYVGGGGMGAVFRALDPTLNRDVAVKVLSPGQAKDEETLRRFKNEAQSAARLDHDNIARVYYVGEDQGVHYIVFEFIEGVNIRDLVEARGPLPLAEAVSYTLQVAEALAHASQRDVIHRDIKPSNVLITPDGKAKLVDMGLARLQQVEHAENELTVSGVTLGTFDYISPEQARDPRVADVRSDLYSLGCSFYYMLTGRPPFPEGTVLQKLLQHQGDHPPDPREFRPDVPLAATRILGKMLAKNPDRRYQLPHELIQDLLLLADEAGLPLTVTAPLGPLARARTMRRIERHLPWMVPLAALVVIVLALDYFWSTGATEPTPHFGSIGTATGGRARATTRFRPVRATVPGAGLPAVGVRGAPPSQVAKVGSAPMRAQAVVGTSDANRGVAGRLAPEPLSASVYAAPPMSAELGVSTLVRTDGSIAAKASRAVDDAPGGAAGTPTERREGLLVVSDDAEGENSFRTLAAACSQAGSGDRIELRFTGRHEENPFQLANAKLTIYAGDGYQPTLVFKPADPLKYPRSMLTLAGGQLTFVGIHLEFDVGDAAADSWALVELRRADSLRFEKCWLTIRDPNQAESLPSAAFFDVRAAGGSDTMTMGSTEDALRDHYQDSLAIELSDCVLRGEASVLRTDPLQPVKLTWDNGLLATTGRLLVLEGSTEVPRSSEQVHVQLRHVTAVARGGLVLLINREDAPYQLITDIKCNDTIIAIDHESSLIEQAGVASLTELQSLVNWNGLRNFYDGFGTFWKITSAAATEPKLLDFAAWRTYWGDSHEQSPMLGHVRWTRVGGRDLSMHEVSPRDFLLVPDAAENPAHRGASDGSDIGFRAERLPDAPGQPPPLGSAAASDPLAR